MAVTEYPAVGSRVRGEWSRPTTGEYLNAEGTVEALEDHFPNVAHMIDGQVIVRYETIETNILGYTQDAGTLPGGAHLIYTFEEVTLID